MAGEDGRRGASERNAFCCVRREFGAGPRLRGPGGTSEGLLHGIAVAGRAQERGADRVDRRSVARLGGTSVASALRRVVGLVGRLHELARSLANRAVTTPIGVAREASRRPVAQTAETTPRLPPPRPRALANQTRRRPAGPQANSPARKGIGAASRS